MQHPETFDVTKENGIAPAGKPDACFWCGAALGGEHQVSCVCRKRTVVIKVVTEAVVTVPEDWTEEEIDFHHNESSWCTANFFDHELGKLKEPGCLCDVTTMNYVREATEEDEESWEGLVEK